MLTIVSGDCGDSWDPIKQVIQDHPDPEDFGCSKLDTFWSNILWVFHQSDSLNLCWDLVRIKGNSLWGFDQNGAQR